MNEKQSRDRALFGAMGIRFDDEVRMTDTPDFDGGARGLRRIGDGRNG